MLILLPTQYLIGLKEKLTTSLLMLKTFKLNRNICYFWTLGYTTPLHPFEHIYYKWVSILFILTESLIRATRREFVNINHYN